MTKPKIAKKAKIANRWNYAVLGADLVELDESVALGGRYCTRAKFVKDAIKEKQARTKAAAFDLAVERRERAKSADTAVHNDIADLGIRPDGVASNPFPEAS